MLRRGRLLVQSVLIVTVGATATTAQHSSTGVWQVPRLGNAVVVDGRVEAAEWNDVEPLPLTVVRPSFGVEPTEQTEIRVAYTETHLYLAARCFDTSGYGFAGSLRRDYMSPSEDYVAIMLDTFRDNENTLAFWVTPAGVRTDIHFFNDAQETDALNLDWNTFWDAAATRTAEGWFAELRIPFSSLRFESRGDTTTMGISAFRWTAQKAEMHMFPAVPQSFGYWSFVKASKTQPASFTGIRSHRPFYVTPYALAGMGQNRELNADESAYVRDDDFPYDVGLDLKYGLTTNLTLDLTANTDFAQVEADNQVVNLTRFSLFFPEKRQFFLERSSNFDFSFSERPGEYDRLFHSRRIGIRDGRTVRLLGGARLVGRVGDWDVGALSMQSARSSDSPSENFSVARIRRRLSKSSYLGAMVTSGLDEDGRTNAAYGVDGVVRLLSNDYIRFNWAQSLNEGEATAMVESGRSRIRWYRQSFEGLAYDVSLSHAGSAFDPSIGYQRRSGYLRLSPELRWGYFGDEHSRIYSRTLRLSGDTYLRSEDRSLETLQVGVSWNTELKTDLGWTVMLRSTTEDLESEFEISENAVVPRGKYTFLVGSLSMGTPSGRRALIAGDLTGGTYFDGRLAELGLSPRWIVSTNIRTSGRYAISRVWFPDRSQSFAAHIVQLRLEAALSSKFSGTAFVQFSSASEAAIVNVRFRYNPREGNDFYLVYNEGLNTDRLSQIPPLPITSSRTVLAKYTYTFIW